MGGGQDLKRLGRACAICSMNFTNCPEKTPSVPEFRTRTPIPNISGRSGRCTKEWHSSCYRVCLNSGAYPMTKLPEFEGLTLNTAPNGRLLISFPFDADKNGKSGRYLVAGGIPRRNAGMFHTPTDHCDYSNACSSDGRTPCRVIPLWRGISPRGLRSQRRVSAARNRRNGSFTITRRWNGRLHGYGRQNLRRTRGRGTQAEGLREGDQEIVPKYLLRYRRFLGHDPSPAACKAPGFWTLVWGMIRRPWPSPAAGFGALGWVSGNHAVPESIARCRSA